MNSDIIMLLSTAVVFQMREKHLNVMGNIIAKAFKNFRDNTILKCQLVMFGQFH